MDTRSRSLGIGISIGLVAILLSGCGNLNTAYRSEKEGRVRTVAVDAKQRFAFIHQDGNGHPIVCPEPSPDALSAGSTNLSLDGSKMDVATLRAALATSEAAANIGLRTQSIQLLRDQLAYLCLMRMADPLGGAERADVYRDLFRRYQIATLGVLAIEQLTGTVKGPTVSITASGQASVKVDSPDVPASAPSEGTPATDPNETTQSPDGATPAAEKANDAGGSSKKGSKAKLPVVNVSATAAAAPAVFRSPADAPTPVQSVAEAVVQIIDRIVTAYDKESCTSALLGKTGNSAAAACIRRECMSIGDDAVSRQTCFATAADDASESKAAKVAAAREAAAQMNEEVDPKDMSYHQDVEQVTRSRVRGQTRRELSALLNLPTPVASQPRQFNKLRFGLFACNAANHQSALGFRDRVLSSKVNSPEQIRDRGGEWSLNELRKKGFEFNGTTGVIIQFDDDEMDAANELKALVASFLPHNTTIVLARNAEASTPLYLSIAFCAR